MSDIKIRCSELGNVMTGLTGLTENQKTKLQEYADRNAGNGRQLTQNQIIEFGKLLEKSTNTEISQTAKSYIEKVFIKNEFGFSEGLYTDPVLKGILQEEDAIEIVSELDRKYYVKNKLHKINDYLTGTPDIIYTDKIIDVKVPDNFENFFKADLKALYFAQGQGYMDLTGIHKFELCYVLMPEPEKFLTSMLYYLSYKLTPEQYDEAEKKLLNNNKIINSLPLSQRVRRFAFDYDPEYIETVKNQIEKCRLYYETLFIHFNLKN